MPQDAYFRIRDSIWKLADEPRPNGSKKLAGRSGWRIRPGVEGGFAAPEFSRWLTRSGDTNIAPMRTGQILGLGSHGFHRMHYTEWGAPENARVLVCVHGLTRNGRDFDWLAEALSRDYRVVCPDLPGRGQSDWLEAPADYGVPLYLSDLVVLLGRLDVEQADWFGTSLGGWLGIVMAAQTGTPIRRLIVNDIGPEVPKEAL
ncbi:MAG: alpha/beta fold hydrolase, partial [Gammaproteobacteria bacterium]